jgi:hypothetical protein
MEGTGSFGAGLLRFLTDYGLTVIEVDRPDRSDRRRNGKSDPLDAESAARAVQSGRASGTPKSRDAQVEMIRLLRVTRRGAMKARIQAGAQLDAVILTAPEQVRAPLRTLARRWQVLQAEFDDLDAQLTPLITATAPSSSPFPVLGWTPPGSSWPPPGITRTGCARNAPSPGSAELPPSPSPRVRTDRYRLHRGGGRQANSALWRIALARMHCHQPTRDYVTRHTAEGKTKTEILHCLKRYIARETYPLLLRAASPSAASR